MKELNFDPNPLYFTMVKFFVENKYKDELMVMCNEGSSRSSKTFDFFHFLFTILDHNPNKGLEVYILRNTLTNCKDYTLKDFKNCWNIIGVDYFVQSENHKPYCNYNGNHIFFRGLDDEKNQEGYPSDIVFINEALEIDTRSKIAGIRMRCRKLMVFDWNPKFTDHWCYSMEGQPNTLFTHSTYRNNKHLPRANKIEIESYCPWVFEDLELPEEERRPNEQNIKNQTADKFRWQVYGEGQRCAQEGLIFKYVNYIDQWPDHIANNVFGQDFGFTNDPSSLVRVGEDEFNIYLELLLYSPTANSDILDGAYRKLGLNTKAIITADSSDKYTGENKGTVEMVIDMQNKGWNISKVSKTKSIVYWIEEMKKKKINIVKNNLFGFNKKGEQVPLWNLAKIEQENYTWKEVNGITINQPIDDYNHFWDASKYGIISLRNTFAIY